METRKKTIMKTPDKIIMRSINNETMSVKMSDPKRNFSRRYAIKSRDKSMIPNNNHPALFVLLPIFRQISS